MRQGKMSKPGDWRPWVLTETRKKGEERMKRIIGRILLLMSDVCFALAYGIQVISEACYRASQKVRKLANG